MSLRYTVSELLLQREACGILKEFLNDVEHLQLYAPDKLPNVPVVLFQSMFSGTNPCKLRTLQVSILHTLFSGLSEKDKEEFQISMNVLLPM